MPTSSAKVAPDGVPADGATADRAAEPPPIAPTTLADYRERLVGARWGNTSDVVADILRDAILDGVLEPGSWLREAELAQELKVSRTPIRDALRTLAAEGLLTIHANQGAVVASMTSEDIVELYAMRETLEGMAARLAARRARAQCAEELNRLLPEMRKAGEERRFRDLARLNVEFHRAIRRSAGNRYLDRCLTDIENAVRRFRYTTYELPGRVDESYDEHVTLAQAIAQRDPTTAERLASEHMRKLAELRLRMQLEGW